MDQSWVPVVLAVVGSGGVLTLVLTGIGKWIASRRDDRKAERQALITENRELQQKIFDMQQERWQYEVKRRESTDQTMRVLEQMAALLDAKVGKDKASP